MLASRLATYLRQANSYSFRPNRQLIGALLDKLADFGVFRLPTASYSLKPEAIPDRHYLDLDLYVTQPSLDWCLKRCENSPFRPSKKLLSSLFNFQAGGLDSAMVLSTCTRCSELYYKWR